MAAAKRPLCGHRVIREALVCGGVHLEGGQGQGQACGARASQRIVAPARIAFRCPDHEFGDDLAGVRLFPIEGRMSNGTPLPQAPPSTADILAVLRAAADALDPDADELVRSTAPLARDACERLAAHIEATR